MNYLPSLLSIARLVSRPMEARQMPHALHTLRRTGSGPDSIWRALVYAYLWICVDLVDALWIHLFMNILFFIHHNPHGFCKIRAENPIYCPLTPPGQPTYYRGSTNQIIYSYSTLGCALGYQADITGYPVYYCRPYNTSNGVYTLVSGDCARTTFFVLSFS